MCDLRELGLILSGSRSIRFMRPFRIWLVMLLFVQCHADVPDIIAMTFETMQYGRG